MKQTEKNEAREGSEAKKKQRSTEGLSRRKTNELKHGQQTAQVESRETKGTETKSLEAAHRRIEANKNMATSKYENNTIRNIDAYDLAN